MKTSPLLILVIIMSVTMLWGCRNTTKTMEGGGEQHIESTDSVIVLHGIPDMFSKGNQDNETYYKDQQGEHRKWETTVELMAMPGFKDHDWAKIIEKALSRGGGKGTTMTIKIVVEQTTPLDESKEERSSGPKNGDSDSPR